MWVFARFEGKHSTRKNKNVEKLSITMGRGGFMRKEEMQIRVIAENKDLKDERDLLVAETIALKEELRLVKEADDENCKTAQALHNRIHGAIAFIEKERFHFCNNNKCCEDGLNWISKEIKDILLGLK